MNKTVILSDTHGNLSAIEKISEIMRESDTVIHLGDYSSDVGPFSKMVKNLYSVKGNCDGGGDDRIITLDGVKILITHGDRYGVKDSLQRLFLRAREECVRAVFYGHTHLPKIEDIGGIKFINPGAMSKYGEKTYCYTVIEGGRLFSKIVPVRD